MWVALLAESNKKWRNTKTDWWIKVSSFIYHFSDKSHQEKFYSFFMHTPPTSNINALEFTEKNEIII